MQKALLLSTLITLLSFVNGNSQTTQDSVITEINEDDGSIEELKGQVLDVDAQTPLLYANIFVLHKHRGAISNETGHFSINISGLDKTDTLRFQYIGYKTRNLTIGQLDSSSVVYLKEEIFNLDEILVFGNTPDAKSIVKKVLQNKDSNYRKTTCKNQVFIRERDITDFDEINFNLKKSSISQLDKEMIEFVEASIPEQFLSYTDFLGNIYISAKPDDSIKLKTDPIRTVSLKERDYTDLEEIGKVFEDVFTDVGEEEYWKVKSGIFGKKIDEENEGEKNDSIVEIEEQKKDTLNDNERWIKYFSRRLNYRLKYTLMDDKDEWEFLHKTGKYNYTLVGGTRVNGEDVYIIDFTPKSGGRYVGRVYISIQTYALVRADYEYGEEKTGRDIQLFGIGYTENHFSGSIYFEKKEDNYILKYFSKKTGFHASFDRNVALIKKKERFLFDKKLNEIKVGIDMAMNIEESVEYLILDGQEIPHKQFSGFEQKEKMEIIFVKQFDDNLWKGFSIIEPTKQMRDYKKQEED